MTKITNWTRFRIRCEILNLNAELCNALTHGKVAMAEAYMREIHTLQYMFDKTPLVVLI